MEICRLNGLAGGFYCVLERIVGGRDRDIGKGVKRIRKAHSMAVLMLCE